MTLLAQAPSEPVRNRVRRGRHDDWRRAARASRHNHFHLVLHEVAGEGRQSINVAPVSSPRPIYPTTDIQVGRLGAVKECHDLPRADAIANTDVAYSRTSSAQASVGMVRLSALGSFRFDHQFVFGRSVYRQADRPLMRVWGS